MIPAIRLQEDGKLQQSELLKLGKINVICGKNNSGKSTLLSAINNNDWVTGVVFTTELSAQFCQQLAASLTGANPHISNYKNFWDDLCADVAQLTQLKAAWFQTDIDDFVAYGHSMISQRDWFYLVQNQIPLSLRMVFPPVAPKIRTVLLPAKRPLALNVKIQTNQKEDTGAQNTLPFLFNIKNQPLNSRQNTLYKDIQNSFTQISSGNYFDVVTDSDNMISLRFSNDQAEWTSAIIWGLGLQDLLIILTCAMARNEELILIEEPESHIHPGMQRKLLSFLRNETDKQYIFTTHSNIFLDNALVDRVFISRFENKVSIEDVTNKASMLDDLGYSVSDNLVSDLIILVEGPTDVPVIEEFLVKLGLYANYEVKIWPLGGDTMDQLNLTIFAEKYSIIAVIDHDPKSASIRKRFQEKCAELNIPCHRLERYSIENYFSIRALRDIFHSQIPGDLNEIKPNKKLIDQIGIDVKKNNRKLAKAMTLEEIEGTDLKDFFDEVKRLLQK